MLRRKIKVLIVDDSLLFRETLARGISRDPGIEVVGTAGDPYEARDLIIKHEPDVMTLDVEMPRMNGIEFLRRLMPQYPIPVVMVSSISDSVFDALNAGAVDFVVKPDLDSRNLNAMINELIIKVKIASMARVGYKKHQRPPVETSRLACNTTSDRLIAIGASTGGTEAIAEILKSLPANVPGIVIVQHMPPVFTRLYAERLNNSCQLEVKETSDGDAVVPGRVLIAPGDYHMRVKKSGPVYSVHCYKGEKVNGHCPSVDVLFASAAEQAGKNAVGVILTGMGNDGAQGLLAMRRQGARTIGQDPDSCVVYGMPKAAYEMGAVEHQVPLSAIAQTICNILNEEMN